MHMHITTEVVESISIESVVVFVLSVILLTDVGINLYHGIG